MSIAFRRAPSDGWSSHLKEVKRCRGTACYGALAGHFGTESSVLLEWRVDRKKPYEKDGGDKSTSNKFLRWRQKGSVPTDATASYVLDRSGGAVRLDRWRDLPLWTLLRPMPPHLRKIHEILEGAPRQIRRILFAGEGMPDADPNAGGRYVHSILERDQMLAIRNLGSLDAFVVLLCLARKGEVLELDTHHYLPTACAFDILPRVLHSNPPLRYRWEGLFACLERIFWQRRYVNGAYFEFPIDVIRSSLNLLEADPAARIPRMSGERLRVVNDEERQAKAVLAT